MYSELKESKITYAVKQILILIKNYKINIYNHNIERLIILFFKLGLLIVIYILNSVLYISSYL
jgi:hypothetical protein